ncbi:pinensin family lanthipeptide [Fulvivirga ulvae]|uniref:pinensin family lanthipeptide n=1 Tax=Fulvivirga ulvae TaxID=2904245 RepID=UPI001F47A93C|nr:pinensin family lanthipeptide [Fulvivirga ulvae]UII31290.1 pinensin family lanthipeptide [Fulvivirga ulvae]
MKKKFKLDDLKVKSFVTDVDGQSQQTVKGGVLVSAFCDTGISACRCPTEFCPSQFCATQEGPLCGGTTTFNPKTETIIFW